MTKTMVAPIIALIALAIKAIFKIDIPEDTQSQIAEAIVVVALVGTNVYGIIKNHKKEVK